MVGALVQMLEDEGLTVEYEPPVDDEERSVDLAGDLEKVLVELVVTGTSAALLAGIPVAKKRLRSWFGAVAKVTAKHRADEDGWPVHRQPPSR